MDHIITKLEKTNTINNIAAKFTLIVDEHQIVHGALFFIPIENRDYKVMIPAPFHEALIANAPPTYKKILTHKEALLLK
ncbi:hypothetical protein [Sphingobacterium lumbrici]|uniref:hypothetical protein n=1 Tax=Sphingobacterium lumbrici TaxID=2559600 RepID=UPI00112EA832|nr:hypothetical protein [Sphingobacterium lumbrici]